MKKLVEIIPHNEYIQNFHRTLQKSLKRILKVTGRRLLLVINKNKKFIGTITDGDIRKLILKKTKTSESIEKFYNKKPKFLEKKIFI